MNEYTRLEVVSQEGRELVHYGKITLSEQDGGRTLKVFLEEIYCAVCNHNERCHSNARCCVLGCDCIRKRADNVVYPNTKEES